MLVDDIRGCYHRDAILEEECGQSQLTGTSNQLSGTIYYLLCGTIEPPSNEITLEAQKLLGFRVEFVQSCEARALEAADQHFDIESSSCLCNYIPYTSSLKL